MVISKANRFSSFCSRVRKQSDAKIPKGVPVDAASLLSRMRMYIFVGGTEMCKVVGGAAYTN